MAKLLKLRRGTTSQHGSFTGAEGEVTVDTDKETLVVHDGSTAGGHPVAAEDMANVSGADIKGRLATTLTNAEIKSDAAIAGTKISPDFGSQEVTTTGFFTSSGGLKIENTAPTIFLRDTNDNPDFRIMNSHGSYKIFDETNGVDRFVINPSGVLTVGGNSNFGAGVDVTGNITATGTANFNGGTSTGSLKIENAGPALLLVDTDNDSDFQIKNENGVLRFRDTTHSLNRLTIASDGTTDITGNLNVGAGIDVTGAVNATTDIKTTGGKYYLDTGFYIGEVSSAGGSAESPDGSTEIVNGQVGKDLNLRAFGDIALGSSNSTANTVAKFQMPVVGASKHGKCILNYVTANAGGNASSSTKLETKSTGVGITGSLDLSNDLNCSGNIYGPNNIGRDTGDKITWVDNTQLDVYVNGNNEFRFEADGDFHADGDIVAFSSTTASDSRLKSDIHTINDALGIVGKLRGVSYKWLRDGKADIGVIAQEVEEVVPEVVKTKTSLGLDGPEEIKTVDYGKLVGVLINAINELKAELDEHKKGGK